MLLILSSLKLVTEIALLALLGQGVLGLMASQGKERNPFYLILRAVGRPFVILMRWLTPRMVLDRHLPLATFLCLLLAWFVLTAAKITHCLEAGAGVCR
jgi:hypothetical protein